MAEDILEANAHLIAAAPALYAALQRALASLRYVNQRYYDEQQEKGDYRFDRIEEFCMAALEKAKTG